MREIRIYFVSGNEMVVMMSEEEAKNIKEDFSYKPASIELDMKNVTTIIPTSSIERIEISK